MVSSKDLTIEEWHEPVLYCRACHSLCVVQDEPSSDGSWDGSYCGKCGSTDIASKKFGIWLREEEVVAEKRRLAEWRK